MNGWEKWKGGGGEEIGRVGTSQYLVGSMLTCGRFIKTVYLVILNVQNASRRVLHEDVM